MAIVFGKRVTVTLLPVHRQSNRCTAKLYQKKELDLYHIYFFGQTNVSISKKVHNAKSVMSKHRLRTVTRKRNNYIIITTFSHRQRYKLRCSGFYYSVKPMNVSLIVWRAVCVYSLYSRFCSFNAFICLYICV